MANTLEELKRIRDEILLDLHLASMDVKTQWQQLEPKLSALEKDLERTVEHSAEKVTDTAADIIDELGKAYRKLRDRIGST